MYGTLVHTELGDWVRSSGLPGVSAEQNWLDGVPVVGNLFGSRRPDIVLRETSGMVLAEWDLKTGSTDLWRPRAEEIRQSMGVGPDVPIIRLSIERGSAIKSLY